MKITSFSLEQFKELQQQQQNQGTKFDQITEDILVKLGRGLRTAFLVEGSEWELATNEVAVEQTTINGTQHLVPSLVFINKNTNRQKPIALRSFVWFIKHEYAITSEHSELMQLLDRCDTLIEVAEVLISRKTFKVSERIELPKLVWDNSKNTFVPDEGTTKCPLFE